MEELLITDMTPHESREILALIEFQNAREKLEAVLNGEDAPKRQQGLRGPGIPKEAKAFASVEHGVGFTYKDGQVWFAVRSDFINLQESLYGIGYSENAAVLSLFGQEQLMKTDFNRESLLEALLIAVIRRCGALELVNYEVDQNNRLYRLDIKAENMRYRVSAIAVPAKPSP